MSTDLSKWSFHLRFDTVTAALVAYVDTASTSDITLATAYVDTVSAAVVTYADTVTRNYDKLHWSDDFINMASGNLDAGDTAYTISTDTDSGGAAAGCLMSIDTFPGTGIASLNVSTWDNSWTGVSWDQILTEPAKAPLFEGRILVNPLVATDSKWEFGLVDTTTRNTWTGMWGEQLTGTGIDSTSRTNVVLFVFDPEINATDCYLCAYDGTTVMWETSTLELSDVADYARLGISINSAGDAIFYQDGTALTTIETACSTSSVLYPWVWVQNRVADGKPELKIDYVSLLQTR